MRRRRTCRGAVRRGDSQASARIRCLQSPHARHAASHGPQASCIMGGHMKPRMCSSHGGSSLLGSARRLALCVHAGLCSGGFHHPPTDSPACMHPATAAAPQTTWTWALPAASTSVCPCCPSPTPVSDRAGPGLHCMHAWRHPCMHARVQVPQDATACHAGKGAPCSGCGQPSCAAGSAAGSAPRLPTPRAVPAMAGEEHGGCCYGCWQLYAAPGGPGNDGHRLTLTAAPCACLHAGDSDIIKTTTEA